jgi:hypothetical protein
VQEGRDRGIRASRPSRPFTHLPVLLCMFTPPIASILVVVHQQRPSSYCAYAAGEAWLPARRESERGRAKARTEEVNGDHAVATEVQNTTNTTSSRTENAVDVLYGRRSEKGLVEVAPADAMNVSERAVANQRDPCIVGPSQVQVQCMRFVNESGWAVQEVSSSPVRYTLLIYAANTTVACRVNGH